MEPRILYQFRRYANTKQTEVGRIFFKPACDDHWSVGADHIATNFHMADLEQTKLALVVHTIVRNARGSILLLERSNTGFMDGCFSLPGGHVEPGESIEHAAKREVYEEALLTVVDAEPKVVMPFAGGVDFIFEAQEWTGVPNIGEPDRCSSIEWFDQYSLPQNVVPFVPKALELVRSGRWYFEFNG